VRGYSWVYSSHGVLIEHTQASDQTGTSPGFYPQQEIVRNLQLALTTELLLRKFSPRQDPGKLEVSALKDGLNRMWNIHVLPGEEETTVAEARKLLSHIIDKEPDLFSHSLASSFDHVTGRKLPLDY
jgi:hypothetical protein